jgi:predicted naringenin-chalcone synthase
MRARIAGTGRGLPPVMVQTRLWDDFFGEHYGHSPVARRIWGSTGIQTRHGVVNPAHEDVSAWGTEARMRRFQEEAMPLGKDAVSQALEAAGVAAEDVGLFTVVSSTGYATPGLDILLARDLGMSERVQRLHLGHMGCYAALPAVGAASDYVVARQRPAVVLSVELTSLHVQRASDTARQGAPTAEDLQQIVAHALFADAAAAVVLTPESEAEVGVGVGNEGWVVVDVQALTDPSTAGEMTWDVTDHGFRMGLSPQVPDILGTQVGPMVERLLADHGLGVQDVDGWAVHPGGRRILDEVAGGLGLHKGDLASSYEVLRDMGNCSSATVLLVVDQLLATRTVPPGGWVVAMAFGPGLTIYTALLKSTR